MATACDYPFPRSRDGIPEPKSKSHRLSPIHKQTDKRIEFFFPYVPLFPKDNDTRSCRAAGLPASPNVRDDWAPIRGRNGGGGSRPQQPRRTAPITKINFSKIGSERRGQIGWCRKSARKYVFVCFSFCKASYSLKIGAAWIRFHFIF